jgi:prefoldin alpha subunit
MVDDNELRQALMILENYEAQLEALDRQVRLLQVSLEDTARARDSFKALADAKEGDEILIPVGASSFMHAKVTAKRTAIVGIGNRVSVEKDLNEAVAFMTEGVNEISAALKDSITALNEIQTATDNLSNAIETEYRIRQQADQ